MDHVEAGEDDAERRPGSDLTDDVGKIVGVEAPTAALVLAVPGALEGDAGWEGHRPRPFRPRLRFALILA